MKALDLDGLLDAPVHPVEPVYEHVPAAPKAGLKAPAAPRGPDRLVVAGLRVDVPGPGHRALGRVVVEGRVPGDALVLVPRQQIVGSRRGRDLVVVVLVLAKLLTGPDLDDASVAVGDGDRTATEADRGTRGIARGVRARQVAPLLLDGHRVDLRHRGLLRIRYPDVAPLVVATAAVAVPAIAGGLAVLDVELGSVVAVAIPIPITVALAVPVAIAIPVAVANRVGLPGPFAVPENPVSGVLVAA